MSKKTPQVSEEAELRLVEAEERAAKVNDLTVEHQSELTYHRERIAAAEVELAQAKADLQESEEKHAETLRELEPVPGAREVLVDLGGHGTYAIYSLPVGEEDKPRRFLCSGVNVEHVDEDANGVWRYRAMR